MITPINRPVMDSRFKINDTIYVIMYGVEIRQGVIDAVISDEKSVTYRITVGSTTVSRGESSVYANIEEARNANKKLGMNLKYTPPVNTFTTEDGKLHRTSAPGNPGINPAIRNAPLPTPSIASYPLVDDIDPTKEDAEERLQNIIKDLSPARVSRIYDATHADFLSGSFALTVKSFFGRERAVVSDYLLKAIKTTKSNIFKYLKAMLEAQAAYFNMSDKKREYTLKDVKYPNLGNLLIVRKNIDLIEHYVKLTNDAITQWHWDKKIELLVVPVEVEEAKKVFNAQLLAEIGIEESTIC